MVELDKAFSPEHPLELTWLYDEDEIPSNKDFKRLDHRYHLERLEKKEAIFLSDWAHGGSANKFVHHKVRDYNGQLFLIYRHVHNQFPFAGILVHSHQPIINLIRELHWREDGEVVAVAWTFAATGNYAFSRFFYANDPC